MFQKLPRFGSASISCSSQTTRHNSTTQPQAHTTPQSNNTTHNRKDCHLTLEEGKYDFLFLVLRRNTIFQSELKSAQTFQR
ncbi:unnamed protein product [Callosobruchus maculatus]|uniref:Uncharacterized protein n=1 Tax=Callosobruchus maculatus TaxID=64391 RepID=A0A653BM52_CALMS|nr:unnamed protein product [Callosobruchus maculatus]